MFLGEALIPFIILNGVNSVFAHHSQIVTESTPSYDSESCFCLNNEVLFVYKLQDGVCACKCIPPNPNLNCKSCPADLYYCARNCCYNEGQICTDAGFCSNVDELDFVTAAKVAVLFALVVTCLAVLAALFRSFFLPRWCNARNSRLSRSEPERISINSVQRFVLERIRSRPPPYEHQPEKPPSYEDVVNDEAPPAYSAAVVCEGVGDPPPYSSAIREDHGTEVGGGEQGLILSVRTLSDIVPIHNRSRSEGVGHSNAGFQSDESTSQEAGGEQNSSSQR